MTKKVYALGLTVLLSAICITSSASAQTSWQRTYGGTLEDYGFSVQQTADGGYVVAGYTRSFATGIYDVYLVKTNAQGDTLWTKAYGGTNANEGYTVQQTADGGYIIGGYTNSIGAGYHDVYLIKTNASGDSIWARAYGGTSEDFGYSVQQTSDGGYIIAGSTPSGAGLQDIYLIKTSASGDTLWTRAYGGADEDWGNSVRQTADGGYIVAGTIGPNSWLIKTNAYGDTLWTRTIANGSAFHSVIQTTDGGYVIAGGVSHDVYLVKTNAQGDTVWTRTYGGAYPDRGYSVQQTTADGYIIAGSTASFGPRTPQYINVYLIRTNAEGDTLWTRAYGGAVEDWGRSVQQTSDGGYVIAGYTRSFGAGGEDIYLIKADSFGNVGVAEPVTGHPVRPTRFLVQPNPFTSFARIPGHETDNFVLSDVTGRQVAVCRGDRVGEGLRPGVYFLSPVGLRAGKSVIVTIVKAVF